MLRCVKDFHAAVMEEGFSLLEFDTEWVGMTEDGEKVLIDGLAIGQDDLEEETIGVEGVEKSEDDEDDDGDNDDEDDEDDEDDDDEVPNHPPRRRPENHGNPFVVIGLILMVSLLILVLTIIKCVMQGKRLMVRVMVCIDPGSGNKSKENC